MSRPFKGQADYYSSGDWNSVCYECGRKRKASELMRHWQGYYVCKEHWEPRQPQDFARATPDDQSVSWTQPSNDLQIAVCCLEATSSIAGFAVAGCAVAGRPLQDIPLGQYCFCTVESNQPWADHGTADCAITTF